MNITKENINIICDISGCTNKAEYRLDLKKNIYKSKTYICENCMNEIYSFIAKQKTPKSVKNVFAKPKKVQN